LDDDRCKSASGWGEGCHPIRVDHESARRKRKRSGTCATDRLKQSDVHLDPSEWNERIASSADFNVTRILIIQIHRLNVAQQRQYDFKQGQVNLPYLVIITLPTNRQGQPIWTLGRQPPWGVRAGDGATVRIVASQAAPLTLLLPFLRGAV
jgi:hypothetical protein